MSKLPDWLPELILLENYSGSWRRYEDEVYSRFYRDFIESRPMFQGMPVKVTKQLVRGKERNFWHLIQEGRVEENRIPDLRRCERISWIRAIIQHSDDSRIKNWSKKIRRKIRHLLWFEEAEYLVVLEKRANCWILWTAYCTSREHTKRRLRKEYYRSLK